MKICCNCPPGTKQDLYGPAIVRCSVRADKTMWVDNDEYCTQVNYCPFCGKQAEVMIELDNYNNEDVDNIPPDLIL